ncbi:hypothetical protein [Anaerovibrio sp. RM50]|nr:hypothetical protein [Anaerovibrio sp. RM50]
MKHNSDVAITFSIKDYLEGINPKKNITNVRNMLARLPSFSPFTRSLL